MDYKQAIIDSEFSSHELADVHRATGSQDPPDWKGMWELLNDHSVTVGENLEFYQSHRDAAIQRHRQEAS